jgi:hypothetical protein
VSRMIRGDSWLIQPDDQRLIAAWVTETSLVRLVTDRFHRDNLTAQVPPAREELLALMETGVPSGLTSVRIGYWSMKYEHHAFGKPTPRPFVTPARKTGIILVAPSYGSLKWEPVIPNGEQPSAIGSVLSLSADSDRLVRFWPPKEPPTPIEWPPLVILDMAQVEAHQASWADTWFTFERLWRTPGT